MARQVASLYGVLTLRDSDYRTKLAENRANTASFSSQLTTIGSQMQSFGTGMTALMAPVGLALGVSVNNSRDFASEMANVNSIIQLGTDDASAMRAEVLAFGSQNTFGPIANAAALYSIVSAGITDTSVAMEVLNQSVNTAEAGQADLNATTAAMVSLMNSYSLGADGAQYASDILARTVQTGVGTMGEFATALPTVTGLSSQFGINLDEVAGSLSYMTTQGFSASQSATFLRSMITTLLNPTADLEATIRGLGYESGQAFLESEGLVGAYQLLAAQDAGLAGLITNQEALTGSLVITGDTAGQVLTDFTLGVDGAAEAMREAQEEAQGWDRLSAAIEGLSVSVGNSLSPVLLQLVEDITPVVLGITDWMAANPELTSQIFLVVGALVIAGPIIAGVGFVLSGIGTIIGVVTGLFGILTSAVALGSAAFVGAGGGVAGMGAAVLAVLGPVGLMIIAVGALVAWMSGREGGLVGSLQEAMVAFNQLIAIIEHATGVYTTFNQARQLVQGVFNGSINSNQIVQAVQNEVSGQRQQVGGGGRPRVDGERALGGPVTAGRSYLVGEEGPEIYTPAFNGNVTPNSELGQGRSEPMISVGNIVVHANNAEQGRAAGRAAFDEITDLARSRGITLVRA